MLTAQHPVTRRTKAAYDHDGHVLTSPDRAAKRRRTEASYKDVPTVTSPHEKSIPPDANGPSQQHASDDIDSNLSELHAQLEAHPQHDGPGLENEAGSAETFDQLDADMTKAISDIIDHSERFELQCTMGAADNGGSPASKNMVFAKTGSRMKVESLPILDNLVSMRSRPRCPVLNY